MKFSNVLLFATAALAAPALVERQTQTTVIGSITDAANGLNATVQTSLDQINTIITSIKTNVGAEVTVLIQAQLKYNIQAIADTVSNSTTTIVGATTLLLNGSLGNLVSLTTEDITALCNALKSITVTITAIRNLIVTISTDLPAAIKQLVQGEVAAVKAAIAGLSAPLNTFIAKALASLASSTTITTNLVEVLQSIGVLLKTLLNSLGLGGLLGF